MIGGHQFFMKIVQSFPCLTVLSIFNQESQRNKRLNEFDDNINRLSIIEFSRLNDLTLFSNHIDYLEQYLVEINIQLAQPMNICKLHPKILYAMQLVEIIFISKTFLIIFLRLNRFAL